jgi:alkanesulfonate monooxygenase SsuD/methylene tetrahydromethanopterin reductase-like flavin-dependent oxidoreductase (luciferase family)
MRMTLRYDMRQPDAKADKHRQYEACIEQCVWADRLGFEEVFIGEHHGADDGYIPSAMILASAIAARTKNIKLHLSALLLPMHHPLRLAEDLAVLDIVSNGRVKITAGMGYRPSEFEMLGVDHSRRLRIYLDAIDTLHKAWTGEPFEFQGRTVRVRPTPIQPGGPKIIMGGSVEAAAERAARMGLDFMPGHPALYETYKAERAKLGMPPPPPLPNFGPTFIYVTRDPEAAWPVVAPHILHATNSYAAWAKERGKGSTLYSELGNIDEIKANPLYQVVTPVQAVDFAQSLEPHGELQFQPLFGGLDPAVAWESLELFERESLPLMKQRGLR